MATKVKTVSEEARRVLERCVIDEARISLPTETLDRKLYQEVNAVLESLGGKWSKREKAHVFTEMTGDALADAFYDLVSAGAWTPEDTHDFFPTPDWLVTQMIERADLQDGQRVLEPSAGEGAILRGIWFSSRELTVEAIELDGKRAAKIPPDYYTVCMVTPFLDYSVPPELHFDRILMNPPFSKGQAVKHVQHAIGMLKPGGVLVAIMPNGIVQRQDRAHRELRQEIMRNGAIWPIEDGAFKATGTMVRTVMLRYQKPAETKQEAILAPAATKTGKEPLRRFRRLGATQ